MTGGFAAPRTDRGRRAERDLGRPEEVAERLAAMASAAEPGRRLGTKEELRALCEVSVGTFNEALRMAQSRGVVTVRRGPGGGLFAGRPSPMVRLGNSMLALDEEAATVAEAVRLRNALDPLLVQDALEHATSAAITALRTTLDQMWIAARDGDATAFVRANWALHARIAETSPGPMLRSIYLSLLDMIETHTLSVLPVNGTSLPAGIQERYRLHADLVQAISEGAPRALDIIREHNTEGQPGAGP